MHIPLLTDIVILLGVSLGVLYGAHGLRLPPVLAFLVTGVLLGPHGFAVIQSVHEVEQLAEIGVILVLFAIGLEFSLADLMRMRRTVIQGAGPHVDGQILVLYDALGITQGRMPRFVKNFMADADSIPAALYAYVDAVKQRAYPAPEHCFS